MHPDVDTALADARSDDYCDLGKCLAYVVDWWNAPKIGCPDAITSWEWALHKHPNDRNPPAGAPVYYRGGQYGHIAISVGGGRIRSTDCHTSGMVSEQPLDWPEKNWGYPYLGWTEDLSKERLPLEGDDDVAKPTDVVGKDTDGTDLTLGELTARINWLYEQWLASGSLKDQLNRIEKK